jgi:hypothetical protein
MIRFAFLLVIVACAVLFVTNPNQDSHRKAVYESIAASKTQSEFLGRIAADFLGDVDVLPLKYNNYYLFSTTTMNGDTVSVGGFSRVWKIE